ncbi:phage holin family protein [Virgibacillus sediminis]|uniref:Phage holin family protein n=1 Tax=Virgibacillus sediminis TaxID=202260 RepID=A0ABV7A2K6_9BACI
MLLGWLVSLVLNAVALIVVAQLFGSFHLEGFGAALLASFILAILNLIVKPILIVLTLPITLITFGLFLFVVNAVTLMIAQSLMGPSFTIDGFGMAIIASIVISVLNLLLNSLIKDSMR